MSCHERRRQNRAWMDIFRGHLLWTCIYTTRELVSFTQAQSTVGKEAFSFGGFAVCLSSIWEIYY